MAAAGAQRRSRSPAAPRDLRSTRRRSTSMPIRPSRRGDGADGKDHSTRRPGSWSLPVFVAGRVHRGHPADDRGQLFGAGHLRQQQVLLERRRLVPESCSIPRPTRRPLLRSLGATSSSRRSCSPIEVPLGIVIALAMPQRGLRVVGCRWSLLALPLLIPWNVVGTIWQIFGAATSGLLGSHTQRARHRLQLRRASARRLVHDHRHGRLALDDAWSRCLCYAGLESIPDAYYQAGHDRRRLALGGVPLHRAAQAEARAD